MPEKETRGRGQKKEQNTQMRKKYHTRPLISLRPSICGRGLSLGQEVLQRRTGAGARAAVRPIRGWMPAAAHRQGIV
jgi:hypothetical protein